MSDIDDRELQEQADKVREMEEENEETESAPSDAAVTTPTCDPG